MENNFYRDDFESFLKESADDFRMVPSRKVWYSIYNNMHPDRKWPSVAVCLIILSAVLFIGVSNNNSLSESARLDNESRLNSAAAQSSNIALAELPKHQHSPTHIFRDHPAVSTAGVNGTENDYDHMPADIDLSYARQYNGGSVKDEGLADANRNVFSLAGKTNITVIGSSPEDDIAGSKKKNISAELLLADSDVPETDNSNTKSSVVAATEPKKAETQKLTADVNRPWIEDYAFRNKPKSQSRQNRFSLNYYVTPSLGYRAFFKNNDGKTSSSVVSANLNDIAALNLEAGASLMYRASEKLRLKGGLQINYTNYVSKVTDMDHPTQANLATRDMSSSLRYSEYAVQDGFSSLNKTTLQVSVPLGADLKILGNGKFKWYVGATLQPTYILGGSSYVLSQDAKNYISETPLLRRWNLNTAVETFVSFKPSNGISVNVGPQFRYQLLSTYKKEYNYSEKLYNIGVKVGVVTGF